VLQTGKIMKTLRPLALMAIAAGFLLAQERAKWNAAG
jgi:hypothetical protein